MEPQEQVQQQQQQQDQEKQNSLIQNARVCLHCVGFYVSKEYEKHVSLGPFAEYHTLQYCNDIELQMLLTLNVFDFGFWDSVQ